MKTQNEKMAIRIPNMEKDFFKKAAEKKRLSLSEFLRRSALKEAEKTLGVRYE